MPSVALIGLTQHHADPLFQKLLIANRGEIACRIIRTARRLEIPVVSVYSDADRNAMHVSLADESIYIGGSRPSESYLNVGRIMEAAIKVGADALHPGYGFLSENSALSKACEKANIEFVGPPSSAIKLMASKSNAADIAIKAGVPVVPGFRETGLDDSAMMERAEKIGYPVLLKAALGGGGRGMSVVHSEDEFAESLEAVRSQAQEFFGDDLIIVEKYLNPARHVEVQVAADKHGNVLHLFDRDCSAQRRYQKIVEEAPAPKIKKITRRRIHEAAVSLTKALDYHSVGTIEFLYSNNVFYFMEMNTRLQVEHPVTEQVTNTDLVEWQLRIAAGESIKNRQVPKAPIGHSIQARIYAENPEKGFLPSPGSIEYLHLPAQSDHLQMHTGVRQGDVVDLHYDPLIAKIVVRDADRERCIERLRFALNDFHVVGVDTNIKFLSKLLESAAFRKTAVDIKFVESNLPLLTEPDKELPIQILVLALLYVEKQSDNRTMSSFTLSDDHYSPWRANDGWRLNSRKEYSCSFEWTDKLYNVSIIYGETDIFAKHKDQTFVCRNLKIDTGSISVKIDGNDWRVSVFRSSERLYIFHRSSRYELRLTERIAKAATTSDKSGSLAAPLPGRVARVMVEKGEVVSSGQCLIVIEAMKMEHQITSPIDGIVVDIPFGENQLVNEGANCVEIEPLSSSGDDLVT